MHRSGAVRGSLIAAALLGLLLPPGAAHAATLSFTSSGPIAIPASGTATPYPSPIEVSGFSGPLTDVNVTLHGLTHTWPDDVAVLLVGPTGVKLELMTDSGCSFDVTTVDLTFDDAAAAPLPDEGQITADTYRPSQGVSLCNSSGSPADFTAPAPPAPYVTTLAAFNGTDPNGIWNLYVLDDTIADSGSVARGWSLSIEAPTPPPTPGPPTPGDPPGTAPDSRSDLCGAITNRPKC